MPPLGTASFAGLCLLASCVRAQPLSCPALDGSARGQYCVSFKIVAGKLAVDQDAFRVAPPMVKFEMEIRARAGQAIAKIGQPYVAALAPGESDAKLSDPLTNSLRGNSAWRTYVREFGRWAAANPERLDLGTLFSADRLFADMLTQTPDVGLVLNEEQIEPLSGALSFSILAPFDPNTVHIELPAMTDLSRSARIRELRKHLGRLSGSLWSSADIRNALGPLYANLGLTPQLLVLARNQTIQIIEGPRIAAIVLPMDQVPARDLDRVLWDLLDTGHFHRAMRTKNSWAQNRAVDFNRDLGYLEGDEPYAIQYQLQAMQLLISPLGYTLATQPSARTGSSQYVELSVQKAAKKHTRYLGAGFAYKPGQGFSVLGTGRFSSTSLSVGGPSGDLGAGNYSSDFMAFERLHERVSASFEASTSTALNRFLNGVKVDERSTAALATFEWQPWRGLDGTSFIVHVAPSYTVVLNQSLTTIDAGAQFVHYNLTSEYPWHLEIDPRVLINLRFVIGIVVANIHRSFDAWEYDVSGRLENTVGHAPLFELPSLGGSDTVRGFRADDAIGRRLWSTQNEVWHAIPQLHLLKIATFFDLGGAYQTSGSYPGLRAGTEAGLRLDFRLALLKFDWAYGFGEAATGGSRGKFYFSIALNTRR